MILFPLWEQICIHCGNTRYKLLYHYRLNKKNDLPIKTPPIPILEECIFSATRNLPLPNSQ